MLALLLSSAALSITALPPQPPAPTTVTILYDAFGTTSALRRDWGFAALIEYQGKRILFDTGNDAAVLAQNAQRLHADLAHLDFVVISHRHSDHAAGLSAVLRANPNVPIYAPRESFGIFGSMIPGTFYRASPTLPDSMRYFDGMVPDEIQAGTLWPRAAMILVDSAMTIAPGIRLISLVSETAGTRELHELSLVLSAPTGDILIVGCSHPGIERILAAAGAPEHPVRTLLGGLHLVATPDSVIDPLVRRLHRQWNIAQVAPGHCTGEPAFAALRREYMDDYIYAGLGRRLTIQ
jgi:7,8-dihydropterin-6-yl-methyl-4-(beta-D-ribofuranosyl)aminobenzene 5'-phosphate synthase